MWHLCCSEPATTYVFLSQADTPAWHCSRANRRRVALRAFSSSALGNVSSLRLVFLPSSHDPGSWDPAAVEPSTCPSKGQDLAELETHEAEAAYVSTLHMRAVRALKFCSISANAAILLEKVVTLEVMRTTVLVMV